MNTIYTVIPFFDNGIDANLNGIKSFNDYDEADDYANNGFYSRFEIVENTLSPSNTNDGWERGRYTEQKSWDQ
jgi:hypothetical protein